MESVYIGIEECNREALLSSLREMFENELYTDVTFHVGEGLQVRAHRNILASQSTYFQCLLYGDMKEKGESDIVLEDVPADAFRELLRCMYSGSVACLPLSTAMQLHLLADRFEIMSVKAEVENALSRVISTENVMKLYNHAHLTSSPNLLSPCGDYIDENAVEAFGSDGLFCVAIDVLTDILQRDTLVVNSELLPLFVIQRWLERNKAIDLHDLLGSVRLKEIQPKEMERFVIPCGLYTEDQIAEAMEAQPCVRTRGRLLKDEQLFDYTLTYNYSNKYHQDIVPTEDCNQENEMSQFRFRLKDGINFMKECVHDEPGQITVHLKDVFLVNTLELSGYRGACHCSTMKCDEHENRSSPYSYKVMVSVDGDQWATVVDYSKMWCFGSQTLFFTKMAIKYLKVVQNLGVKGCSFIFESCKYVDPAFPFDINERGVLAPTSPFTPKYYQEYKTESVTSRLGNIFIEFQQPYCIGHISFDLITVVNETNNIRVIVSSHKRKRSYKVVGEFQDFLISSKTSSKLTVDFNKQVVTMVNLELSSDVIAAPIYVYVTDLLICV